jgi:hypothetical protein
MYWSAIRGATLDLIPPVPIPMIKMAAMKPLIPAPFARDAGRAVTQRMSKTGDVDAAEPDDGPVFSEVLIRDDGTEDGGNFDILVAVIPYLRIWNIP